MAKEVVLVFVKTSMVLPRVLKTNPRGSDSTRVVRVETAVVGYYNLVDITNYILDLSKSLIPLETVNRICAEETDFTSN